MIKFDLNILKQGTLNKYINAERRNRYLASKIKKQLTHYCLLVTQEAIDDGLVVEWPVVVRICWHLPDRRTDPDNWSFLKKFMFDGMQMAVNKDGSKFLANDNLAHIVGFEERFFVDSNKSYAHVAFKKID